MYAYLHLLVFSLFAVHCGGCAEAISPAELVMRAGAAAFHLRCFTCKVCSCRLQTGDRCVLREGQLLCAREDYHQYLASPASSDTGIQPECFDAAFLSLTLIIYVLFILTLGVVCSKLCSSLKQAVADIAAFLKSRLRDNLFRSTCVSIRNVLCMNSTYINKSIIYI